MIPKMIMKPKRSSFAYGLANTGASGLSHWRFGNLDKRLFWKLAPAGMIGGGLGAYVLTAVPGDAIRPIVGIYLGIMGAVVL
jgi:uncharacterized protein